MFVFCVCRMKRFVWKDVPNPNKCSWAKGLDFKTVKEPSEELNLLPYQILQSFEVIIKNSKKKIKKSTQWLNKIYFGHVLDV